MLPRASAKFIASRAKNIVIDGNAIQLFARRVAEDIKAGKLEAIRWEDNPFHPSITKKDNSSLFAFLERNKAKLHTQLTYEEAIANWVFVLDTLNFSFWPEAGTPKYTVTEGGKAFGGYFALAGTLDRALRNDIPIIDAKWCSEVNHEELLRLFTNEHGVQMPMIDERVRSLRENGTTLLLKYDGRFSNCVRVAERSSERLLKTVVEDFPQFSDVAVFENETVAFYKRAQILIADYAHAFTRHGGGDSPVFTDAHEFLTIFADYRVPQVLHFFGALRYSPHLLDMLRNGHVLSCGGQEEVEIRGCTIEACELLRDAVRELLAADAQADDSQRERLARQVNAVSVDNYLWNLRHDLAAQIEPVSPFHRVRSTYY